VLKNNWQPSASLEALKARAEILTKVRAFFKERNVLEVETPILMSRTGSDVNLAPFVVDVGSVGQAFYLQSSPEFAMKRLLATYPDQAFFQIAKAFRLGEAGMRHNPEFTMLEWYRPGYSLEELQAELEALLNYVLGSHPAKVTTYAGLFQEILGLCPYQASLEDLEQLVSERNIEAPMDLSKDQLLDLLMSVCIEPNLGLDSPSIITEFPASQAALARLKPGNPLVSQRFECYIDGIELANAYEELSDPVEQLARFEADNRERSKRGLPCMAIDPCLLEALKFLPDSSGIALGLDRLCLIQLGAQRLSEVISFSWDKVSY
jgi:lysyl-tRNA synthetase class 2